MQQAGESRSANCSDWFRAAVAGSVRTYAVRRIPLGREIGSIECLPKNDFLTSRTPVPYSLGSTDLL
jgi:hypothetical protein